MNGSDVRREFSFYEMACWMCAYSFSDVCALGGRIRPLDKLYDVAVIAIQNEDLMETSRTLEVFGAVFNTKNNELRRIVLSLCNYVPYRLLAYMWFQVLSGKTDQQKNRIIEEMSQSENCFIYSISSLLQEKKSIVIRTEWASYIASNRSKLTLWIDQKIADFIKKRIK